MIPQTNKRGRPPGSGKKDDPYLRQVAALLVREPSLKPTKAMKRVIYARRDWLETESTLLRRFQVKWRAAGESYLVEARRAAEYKPRATLRDVLAAIDGGYRKLEAMPVPPWLASLEKVSSFEQSYKQVMLSPEMGAFMQKMVAFDRHIKTAVGSQPFLEDIKRLTEFGDKFKFQTVLDSPAMRDMAAKLAEADRQMKNLVGNPLLGIPTNF